MSQNDPVLTRLAEILASAVKVDPGGTTRDSRLRGEFGINSLSMIDLVVTVEDAFGVRIPDEDAERFETVGDLADFLQRNSDRAA